ncbi:DUF1080 domain-containing protein [Flammeovirgaceae bacterium SG7u.111]|nr:DUF1080 domain-containing protein [Flammeovirgaceae bacterium SG7u.132]WPO33877.1 DUF1080 domain-containing protein [Flammeovirgaceae bacterium SG7u.111]
MTFRYTSILLIVGAMAIGLVFNSCSSKKVADQSWEPLLDMSLSNWDKFIGVPHPTVGLEGYEKGGNLEGKPLGLNNDPQNVFSTIEMDGETVLRASGEIYGGINTKKEYENYHLSMKFKWGSKKYEPRLDELRDSGILYHCQEPQGAAWGIWMRSQEMQVQEGDCGDYYAIAGTGVDIKAIQVNDAESESVSFIYDPNGEYQRFKTGEKEWSCKKIADHEKTGEWNMLELVCIGDKSYHIVNGRVVMVLERSVAYDEDDVATPLSKGKIQLQSEGAEVYYKEIKIRSVNELPEEFASQLK